MCEVCDKCGYDDFDENGECIYCSDTIKWLKPGTVLDGRYNIVKALKAGGMGAVYRAKDTRLEQICAVKEMLSKEGDDFEYYKKRFLSEARFLADLRHPGIPRVTDYFTHKKRYYLVMDYLEGVDLLAYIADECNAVGIDEETVVKWTIEICDILVYLHGQKPVPILHRDLKPSNIFLRKDKKLMLIDFGLARTVNPDSLGQKTIVGTLGYAPMEQYQGHPDPRSDIYSLSGVMHFLLTAVQPAPFKFEDLKTLRPDISDWLDRIIKKGLSLYPDNRFSSALELKEVLEKKRDSGKIRDDSGELEQIRGQIYSARPHLTQKGFLSHRKSNKKPVTRARSIEVSSPLELKKVMNLAKSGNPEAIDPLIRILDMKDFREKRADIVKVLSTFKEEKVVDALLPLLYSSDELTRNMVPAALAKIGDKRAVKYLAELLDKPDISVKDNALRAIGLITKNPYMHFLSGYLGRDKKEYMDKFPEDKTLYFESLKELVLNLAEEKNLFRCYVHLAVLYEAEEKYADAERNIKRAYQMQRDNFHILPLYVRILISLENYAEAEYYLDKLLKAKLADRELKAVFVDVLIKLKNYLRAIELCKELYDEGKDDKYENKLRGLYYNYAMSLEEVGREEEALEKFESAFSLNKSYEENSFFESLLLFKKKSHKKSLRLIKSYLEENHQGYWYGEGIKLKSQIENSSSGFVGWVKGLWD